MSDAIEPLRLIQALLKQPIAFHRVFVSIAGGACPGIFLSQAWYWSQRTENPEGWFFKTQDDWEAETGLTRREQETARNQLKRIGILREQRRGVPAKMWYCLNLDELQTRLYESAKLECTKRTNKSVQNVQTISEITAETTAEKKEGRTAQLTPTTLMDLYNTTIPPTHPHCKVLSPTRQKKAHAYLHAFPDSTFWEAVFQAVGRSALLRGERNGPGHQHFKATFDWFLQKGQDGVENCVKTFEGKYDDTVMPEHNGQGQIDVLSGERIIHYKVVT